MASDLLDRMLPCRGAIRRSNFKQNAHAIRSQATNQSRARSGVSGVGRLPGEHSRRSVHRPALEAGIHRAAMHGMNSVLRSCRRGGGSGCHFPRPLTPLAPVAHMRGSDPRAEAPAPHALPTLFGKPFTFGRRRRRVLLGIKSRISSSLPKHRSRSPGSSSRSARGLGITVVPR